MRVAGRCRHQFDSAHVEPVPLDVADELVFPRVRAGVEVGPERAVEGDHRRGGGSGCRHRGSDAVARIQALAAPCVVGLPGVDRGLDEDRCMHTGSRADDEGDPRCLAAARSRGDNELGDEVSADPVRAHGDPVSDRPAGVQVAGGRVWHRPPAVHPGLASGAPGHARDQPPSQPPVPAKSVDLDAVRPGRHGAHVQPENIAGGQADLRPVSADRVRRGSEALLRAAGQLPRRCAPLGVLTLNRVQPRMTGSRARQFSGRAQRTLVTGSRPHGRAVHRAG